MKKKMTTGGNRSSVRYSLIDDELGCQDPDDLVEDDTFEVKTMTRSTNNSFAGRLTGFKRIIFLAVLFTSFVIIVWLLFNMDTNNNVSSNPQNSFNNGREKLGLSISSLNVNANPQLKPDGSKIASELRTDLDSEEIYKFYRDECFQTELGRSVPDIYKKLQILKVSSKDECRLIWEIFNVAFRIEEIEAPISLPIPFQQEVKGWLDNDEKLFDQVNHQKIYKITNRATFEETVINPIRAKRPVSKPDVDPLVYIKNLVETTQPKCDFCKYKNHTAEDVFGRIDNEYSASCSNTFKLAKFHGLFFPKQHSPLNLSLIQIQDLFLHTSKEWFGKAYDVDHNQRFPSLMWDSLPHAGASQVHPHIHGILGVHQYAGGFESWHQLSLQYYNRLKRSFWSDFVKLHFALGLGVSSGKGMLILPLNARKDNEYMILSPNLNENVAKLIFTVLQTYQNQLNVYCFSGGAVYPLMGGSDNLGLPVIFRFGSRGTCTSVGSDVSSLELYTINNINSDLAKAYNGLSEQIKQMRT